MSDTPRTDELKRGIWRLMQSQEREEAYAWRDAIHCGIEQLERDLAAALEENARLKAELAKLRQMVAQQAEDDGLWFNAATAPEAYLQQELRRLHAAVEGAK